MIRLAEYSDLQKLTDIYNEAISTGFRTAHTVQFTREQRRSWFELHNENYPLYVIVVGNEVVGYAEISPYRPGRQALRFTAEVSFYIDSAWQAKGLGKTLLRHIESEGIRLGFRTFIAIVLELNNASVQLLTKAGYSKWGDLPMVADFNGTECGHLYFGKRIA